MSKTVLSDKKIVVIGGGTGTFTVLSGLKKYFSDLTAIVTMADDGGSSGRLREEFGILPPGDIRQALIALSRSDNAMLARLFGYRFLESKSLKGHSFGNILLTALERLTGDFQTAILEAGKILGVRGAVIPVTLDNVLLFAELDNGDIVRGETNVDVPQYDHRRTIARIWLEPKATVNPRAIQAIADADLVVIGPGGFYTSILPHLLIPGIVEALQQTNARVAYVANLMTKGGETNDFRASDFLRVLESYLGPNVIDAILVNTKRPATKRFKPYAKEGAGVVAPDLARSSDRLRVIRGDFLRDRGFLRHDSEKVAKIIRKLV